MILALQNNDPIRKMYLVLLWQSRRIKLQREEKCIPFQKKNAAPQESFSVIQVEMYPGSPQMVQLYCIKVFLPLVTFYVEVVLNQPRTKTNKILSNWPFNLLSWTSRGQPFRDLPTYFSMWKQQQHTLVVAHFGIKRGNVILISMICSFNDVGNGSMQD